MSKLLLSAALGLCLAGCASSSPDEASLNEGAMKMPGAKGALTIAGVSASEALGAIDTSKLVGSAPEKVTANQRADGAEPNPPGSTENTITVEGVTPAAVLAAIDPTKLVTGAKDKARATLPAEVQAVVESGRKYTTKDLAEAQAKAMRNGRAPG